MSEKPQTQSASIMCQVPEVDTPTEQCAVVGFPPPLEQHVPQGSLVVPEFLNWCLLNQTRLLPCARVSRGEGQVVPLPTGPALDIDSLSVSFGTEEAEPMAEIFAGLGIDGFLVMHRGAVVCERYVGDMTPTTQHAVFSCTKSIVGLLAETLISEGRIVRENLVACYVPELANTAIGNATVEQLLDMRAHFNFGGIAPRVPGQLQRGYLNAMGLLRVDEGRPSGPQGVYEILVNNTYAGPHGGQFRYDNGSTDALGWILRRTTGQSLDALIGTRLWSRLGAEQDATMVLDVAGTEWAAGGLSMSLRDAARLAEMIRTGGSFNGATVVPSEVISEIRNGGDRESFFGDPMSWRGGSYHRSWWFYHDKYDSFGAVGQFGQRIWIAPLADTVIIQFASDPDTTMTREPFRLKIWQTIAAELSNRNAPA